LDVGGLVFAFCPWHPSNLGGGIPFFFLHPPRGGALSFGGVPRGLFGGWPDNQGRVHNGLQPSGFSSVLGKPPALRCVGSGVFSPQGGRACISPFTEGETFSPSPFFCSLKSGDSRRGTFFTLRFSTYLNLILSPPLLALGFRIMAFDTTPNRLSFLAGFWGDFRPFRFGSFLFSTSKPLYTNGAGNPWNGRQRVLPVVFFRRASFAPVFGFQGNSAGYPKAVRHTKPGGPPGFFNSPPTLGKKQLGKPGIFFFCFGLK